MLLIGLGSWIVLELSKVKRYLQDHLQEGLLIVVGTGPSIAEGIPGMGALAEHLKVAIPPRLVGAPDPAWARVAESLTAGNHLESAMEQITLLGATVDAIVVETARLVLKAERKVIEQVLAGSRVLPFSVFAKHLFKAARKFHLITTNYDRLIEVATEAVGIGVDSRFFGYLHAAADPKRSADAHRESFMSGKNASFRSQPCLCVHKPHGSLDWFDVGGRIVRCPIENERSPMVITPGTSKYKQGYQKAFDDHRTAGNRAVDHATRFLFIGYGFNDDHLEQHLCPGLKLSKPTVIITKVLSANATKILKESKGTEVLALSAVSDADLRTRIANQEGDELIVEERLWNLEGFNQGVL